MARKTPTVLLAIKVLIFLSFLPQTISNFPTLGAAILIADINDTKSGLTSLNLPKTMAIGTSDAGSYFNNEVLSAVDYGVRYGFFYLFLK